MALLPLAAHREQLVWMTKDRRHFDFKSKKTRQNSALKYDLLSNLAELSYWNRNGGIDRVMVLLKNWFKFDKCVPIDNHDSDCQALICVGDKSKVVCVVYRGTTNFQDWMQNLKIRLIKWTKKIVGIETHLGALESVNSVDKAVTSFVKPLVHKGYKVVYVGHSKGGHEAVTAMIAHYEKYKSVPWLTFTLGQPRLTNKESAKILDPIFRKVYYRVRNGLDLVCNIPFRLMTYRHFGTPIHLNFRGKLAIKECPVWMKAIPGFVKPHYTNKYINKVRKYYKLGDPI